MPLKSSLTRPSAAGRALLDELHLLGSRFDPDDHYEVPARLVTAAKRLGLVEKATTRVSIPPERPDADLPLMLEGAGLRLAILDARGILAKMSGTEVATLLQEQYGPTRGNARRLAAYGWALLAALDVCGLATVTVSTLSDAGRYEAARLWHVLASEVGNHVQAVGGAFPVD